MFNNIIPLAISHKKSFVREKCDLWRIYHTTREGGCFDVMSKGTQWSPVEISINNKDFLFNTSSCFIFGTKHSYVI